MGTSSEPESGRNRILWMLLVAGTAVALLGIAIIILASVLSGGSTSIGTIIFIGPIPIMVGSGSNPTLLALIAAIITLAIAVMFLAMRKRTRIS